jgi:hypothetical protein
MSALDEISRVVLGTNVVQMRDILLVNFNEKKLNNSNIISDSLDDMEINESKGDNDNAMDIVHSNHTLPNTNNTNSSNTTRKSHLLVGLGDGTIITFVINLSSDGLPQLLDRNEITIGKCPISFSCFVNYGEMCVFASCDRPVVITSRNNNDKLLYSIAILPEMNNIIPFNSMLFPNCLAMSSQDSLSIGIIDNIQKIHVTSYPLGESPRRLCYHKESNCYAGIITI